MSKAYYSTGIGLRELDWTDSYFWPGFPGCKRSNSQFLTERSGKETMLTSSRQAGMRVLTFCLLSNKNAHPPRRLKRTDHLLSPPDIDALTQPE